MVKISLLVLISLSFMLKPAISQVENWTHLRGSNLNEIADTEMVPVFFNDTLNGKWKTEISGKGSSLPAIYGDQVWVTTTHNQLDGDIWATRLF